MFLIDLFMGRQHRGRRWWLAAVGALGLISALYLNRFVLDGDLLIFPASGLGTDLLTHRWADASVFVRGVREGGQFPLWDPTIMGGQPTIGNPAIIQYYPAWWLFLFLPKVAAFTTIYLLHIWLGGLGMLLVLRIGYHTSRAAAFLGAIAFMLAPKFTGHLAAGHFDMTFPALWLPWAMLGVMLALERRQPYWAVLAGIPLALGYYLHVHPAFFATFFVGLYLTWRLIAGWLKRRDLRAVVTPIVLSSIVPISLVVFAAAQILPWLTLLPHATRQQWSLVDGNWWALPPSLLGGILFMPRTQFPEWTMYLGVLPLALCGVALLRPRQRYVLFLVSFLVFSVVFSLGLSTPLYGLLFRYMPGFGLLRVPPRMMFIAVYAVAALAALGWDGLWEPETRRRLARLLPLIAWGGGILVIALVVGYIVLFKSVPIHVIRTGGLLALVAVLLWLVASRRSPPLRSRAALTLCAVALLLVDLLPTAWHFLLPTPIASALPAIPVFDYVQAQGGLFRTYALQGNLPYEQAGERNVHLLDGQQSFQISDMAALVKHATGCDFEGFGAGMPPCAAGEAGQDAALKTRPNPKLLGMLNVRWLAAEFPIQADGLVLVGTFGALNLYENRLVLPRAYVVGTVEVVAGTENALRRLDAADTREVALVSAGDPLHGAPAPARITEYTNNRLVIETTLDKPGMLVVADAWLEGWQATVNGMAVPVERVNVALRGVRLSGAGSQRIEMTYQPPLLVPGLAITLSGLALVALWTVWRFRQFRSGARSSPPLQVPGAAPHR